MADVQYERLSSLDASFLALETRSTHMHVASISIFDGQGLTDDDGRVDIDRIRSVHRIPPPVRPTLPPAARLGTR